MVITMPADFQECHAAILRDPEDDALRSHLSIFLHPIAQDQSAFISMQLERARQERQRLPGHTEPSASERALLARHEAEWTRLVAPYVQRRRDGGPACTFHRGLIAQATVDPEVFVEHGERLLATAPIRHVDFTPPRPGVLPRLLANEALARLDSVGLVEASLDDDAVAAIAASPQLVGCLYLDLSLNRLGPAAFAAIAASPHLRQVLVVDRAQHVGLAEEMTWHPGEVVVVQRSAGGTRVTLQPMRPEARELEARHGFLPWLHAANRVARLDARWFVNRGYRPVAPLGSPA